MIDDMNKKWDEFENMGIKDVAQKLAQGVLGEAGDKAASSWLAFKANESACALACASIESARLSAIAVKTQTKILSTTLVINIITVTLSTITVLKLLNYI